MSTFNVEYGYIDGVEDLSQYRPEGYHAVQIDDRLHERYRIIHKLGHGTFASVWLAADERSSSYTAVKLGTADADGQEEEILSQLTKRAHGHRLRICRNRSTFDPYGY
ncbi:hypothetical protein D7B24_002485 [Verticillium nonalfalfae]|uniref:non-specific serine/threonine protein kinase n=1 Tax=Verticillium nonalfalfae TaxID=1051616 RepID=A0A3M9YGA4_9PEZI|nr:uncharacterized protein D7B24_002485 [Verticillium nonalfalfae]RNJ59479.1 hypothetical protein D7B24_002485 [Verticillium nonalfalfae]